MLDPVEPTIPEPVLTEDEEYLKAVVDVYGMPDEGLAGLSPRGKARIIAAMNVGPQYPTRWAAIVDLLSPRQQAKVLECVSASISRGVLPVDYLTSQLEEKAIIWDPIGREYAEEIALFGVIGGEAFAATHFRERFRSYFQVSSYGRPVLDFSKKSKVNPRGREISPDDWVVLEAIELRFAKQMYELIEQGPLLEAYFDARAKKWADLDYIALPFEASNLLSNCISNRTIRSLHGVSIRDGWTVSVQISPGDYLPYDAALEEVRALAQLRDDEISEYIRLIP